MAGGLVQRVVDADHAVEVLERGVEPAGAGRADDGVPGDGHERVDLARPRGVDLLGETRDRHLAEHLGDVTHARPPLAGPHTVGERRVRQRVHAPRDGVAEHQAAGPVEVAGEDVHDVDQPGRERPELLVAGADAAVERRRRRGRVLAGDAPDGVGRDATRRLDALGGEVDRRGPHHVDAVDVGADGTEVDEVLGEEHVHHREEERGVGAGNDGDPLVGAVRGARPTRVDHHDLATAGADAVELAEDVRTREERPLRRLRVPAHDDPVVRPGDVRRRDRPHAPVHQRRGEVLRPLIDGARGVDDGQRREPDEQAHVPAQREVVGGRVADVAGDRLGPVRLDHAGEQLVATREGGGPVDLVPSVAGAHHRHPDAVGVVVEVSERGALRADVSLRPHVGAVAADAIDPAVGDPDLKPAHRLAQRARTEVGGAARDRRRHRAEA